MKILYNYDRSLPNTGADTEQVVNTLWALARRGHRAELLIPGPETGAGDAAAISAYYQVSGEVAVHLLRQLHRGIRGVEKWSHALRAPRHAAAGRADFIYTRNLPGAWSFLRAGRRVVYEHFRPWGDQFPPLQPFLRGILRHPKLVGAIFHSRHCLESYRRLGVPDERLLVAHNGWDSRRIEPRLTRFEARARLGLEPGRFTVVYSGRMNARKGLDVLLAAAREAREIAFVLVGSEGEGPIEAQARLLDNVRVVPWLKFKDLAPWLYAADVLAVPPSLEPLRRHGNTVLPLKLFLYLAAGRAILAPVAPDTAELLADDVNAALVPAGDVAATIRTLRALAADPARAARLGDGSLRTAQGLTWDERAERIERFLQARLAATAPDSPAADPWTPRRWAGEVGRWLISR